LEYLGCSEKLVTPLDIRWLTKFRAVAGVLKLYPFIILGLVKLRASGDELASK